MNEKLIEQIQDNMKSKSTDELRYILRENNRDEWSNEAFQAIQRILIARDDNLTAQSKEVPSANDEGIPNFTIQVITDQNNFNCTNCSKQPGAYYEFYFGKKISKTTEVIGMERKTTTTFEIGGRDRTILCDNCIDEHHRIVKMASLKIFLVCAFISALSLLHIFYIQGGIFPGGEAKYFDTFIRFVSLLSILGGIFFLTVLFENPSKEEKGSEAAITSQSEVIKKFKDKGFDSFWTPKQYQALLKKNKQIKKI